jgi:hypothetical protein
MGGITLARPEFLVLMDAVQAAGVVGLDTLELVPKDEKEHETLVASGIEQLKERGALTVQDGINVLDTTLLGMAMAIAEPDLALVTTRDTPGAGTQLFLHYKKRALVVEQTLPSEQEHRLALVGEAELIDRIMEILPLSNEAPGAEMQAILPQDTFLEVKDLAEAGDSSKASKILEKQGIESAVAAPLLSALANPEFGGTLAVLRCDEAQIVDGRNFAVVQGGGTSWLVRLADSGSGEFELSACEAGTIRSLLTDWIEELSG